MDAGILDVLHHAADHDLVAVDDRVDVGLERVFEEPVDQHRTLLRHPHRAREVLAQRRLVVHDLHGAPTEHIATGRTAPDSRSAPRSPPPHRRSSRCHCRGCCRPRSRRSPRNGAGLRRCRSNPATSRGSARRPPRAPRVSLSGVCPPSCTITPTGCSRSTISSTSSSVSGSK